MEEPILRRTWAEIDLDALAHNYQQARRKIGPNVKLLGVVKAAAYGHGALQVGRKLEALGADMLAVACVDEAAELADYLRTLKEVRPVLVMSHLAASDTPALDDFPHEQARRFHEATENMKAVFPDLKTSLTNSPGLLCWPSYVGDLARPGVTLYGGNPLHGTDRAKLGMGLLPVMEMAAPVLSVHPVMKGATVSYGCLYTAPKDIKAAVVGAGRFGQVAFSLHLLDGTGHAGPWQAQRVADVGHAHRPARRF